jgi:hypothetical protein
MGIKHIFNPMNDDFGFDQLALHEVLKHTDLMFNPIWYSSLLLLSAQGVRYFATGMLGDVLLGGSYYWFPSVHERFRYSLMLSVGMHPDYDSAPHEHSIKRITTNIAQSARRRLNHHRSLLRPDYRQICDDSMRNLESELQLVLFSYVENASNIGGQQIMERFLCEHRDRQYVAGQELLIRAFGESVLPTSDRDFVNLLTNIASVLKHDHYLYYRFFRQTYPHLSKIDVPNLYGSIDAPQLIIELRRAANLTFRKSLKKTRSWVNFHNWMTNSPERLHKYRQEYLNLESIFAPDKVIEYFDAVQRGEQRLYDGNDTLNFLSTALLVS